MSTICRLLRSCVALPEMTTRARARTRRPVRVLRGGIAAALLNAAMSCSGEINDATTSSAIADFAVTPVAAPADGASQLRVTASITSDVAPASRTVVFGATIGTFGAQQSLTVDADSLRLAVVLLTAPSVPGTGFVTAKVGTTVVRKELTFERAPAEALEIGADAPAIKAGFGQRLTVSIQLRRAIGLPSAGDTASVTASAGLLTRPTRSNAAGVITCVFTPGEIPAGPVKLRATTGGAGTKVLSDSLIVLVLPKT